jgi:hypothetical protein
MEKDDSFDVCSEPAMVSKTSGDASYASPESALTPIACFGTYYLYILCYYDTPGLICHSLR